MRALPRTSFSLVVALICGCASTGAAPPRQHVALFDGQSLAGWDGDPRYWSVEDGAITGSTTPETQGQGPTYLIWRGGTVQDFELRFRYRFLTEAGNSGVQYRSQEQPGFQVAGYQADMETKDNWNGILVEMGGRKFLGLRGEKTRTTADGKYEVLAKLGDPAALQAQIKRSDWNEYVITARGNHLVHTINGHVMTDVTDDHPTLAARAGILALQLNKNHLMKVQFKDVVLRRF